MNHEKRDTPDSSERSAETKSNFSQCADRLFSLLDKHEDESYYGIIRDHDDSSKISDLVTMTCRPTGARKQERKGQFNQGLFKFIETLDSDQSTREYFAWIETGLRKPGTEIVPQIQSLNKHGFYELTAADITRQLVAQAETIYDYLRIVDEMNVRQVESFPELVKGLGQVVYKMSFEFKGDDEPHLDTIKGRDIMLRLLRATDSIDTDISKYIRTRSLTRLTRSITAPGGDYIEGVDEEVRADQDAAVRTLEAAMSENLFAGHKGIKGYILSKHHIYRYPFATELLHAQLARGYGKNGREKIYDSDRGAFINDYMLSVIDGQIRRAELNQEQPETMGNIIYFLRQGSYRRYSLMRDPKFSSLMNLANSIAPIPKAEESTTSADTELAATETILDQEDYTTGEALQVVLDSLVTENTPNASEQLSRNAMSAEIVDTLMEPIIKRRLGKKALKSVNGDVV